MKARVQNGKSDVWDVVVVGGGPSGMMAALRAAERDARVILLEKNDSMGKKLLISGGGRCNVTNAEFDTRRLLTKYKEGGKFLFSAFAQYGVRESLDFFHQGGMETKIENEGRVFPKSDTARSVWNVLVEGMKKNGVSVCSRAQVKSLTVEDGRIVGVILHDGSEILGRTIVIATGGNSRPETGSTGDGFHMLKKIGHKIATPTPSLVPIRVKDAWVKKLQGVTLPEIKLSVYLDGEKQSTGKGKILFTHFGVTGPTILNMSKKIGEQLSYGVIEISLDIIPALDKGALNIRLRDLFRTESNKKFKNLLSSLIPAALAPVVVELAGIEPETFAHSVTREDRIKLVETMKGMRMRVTGLLGTDKAVVTSGGIPLTEVNFKTMQSRLYPNLFVVGDMLDIDRPSGGYSLQLCWTTGAVAGEHAAKLAKK